MKNFLRRILGLLVARLLAWQSRPYPFPGGVALVVAPHADDETLGCGGLIARKCARGDAVEVVFVTDSAGSPEQQPAAGEADRRKHEALAALATLGLDPTKVHFLAAPDGRLNRLGPAESAKLQTALIALLQKLRPTEIFVPYLGGGSTEHDATGQLAQAASKAAASTAFILEYPVWAWWNPLRLRGQLLRPGQNYRLELGSTRTKKRAALRCHSSQVEPSQPGGHSALPPVLGVLCTGPREFFFHRSP